MAKKKKKRPVEDDDDYRDDEEIDELPRKPKPRNNAYTGLLAISLLAMIAATTLLYLDFDALSGTIPQPSAPVPELGADAAPTPRT